MNIQLTLDKISQLREAVATRTAAYQAIANTGTAAELWEASQAVKATQRALSAAITEECRQCSNCRTPPTGLVQAFTVKHKSMDGFQIGCPLCDGHEVFAYSLQSARADWNAGKTLNPKRDSDYRASELNQQRLAKLERERGAA